MSRILVVDDEEDLRDILRFNLEGEGFTVLTSSSAEEALETLSTTSCSLIILDVMMDGISGIDMACLLRSRGDLTPIIFLTALGDHDNQLRGFLAGADDYVAKPFAFDTLLARIHAVLRRSSPPAVHNALTRREQLILDLLSSQPGRFFSRGEILQTIWPDDVLVGERSVDVHIARLRKKLGSDGASHAQKSSSATACRHSQ